MNNSIRRHGRGKRWIKVLAVAGLVVTTSIVVMTYWAGKAGSLKPLPKPPALPGNVNQQLSGVTFTRSDNGRQLFVIHASRTVAFKESGATTLKDVFVEFFGRAGKRYDVLKTPEGEYNPSTGNLSTPADVELILNALPGQIQGLSSKPGQSPNEPRAESGATGEPIYITTSKVASRDRGTQLESGTPVSFHLGDISGSARGLRYGAGKSEIELRQDVEAAFRPAQNTKAGAPIRLSASRLLYSGPSEEVRLWGPVKITQGSRTITGAQGLILLDAQNRVKEIQLEGDAHASDQMPAGRLSLRSDVLRGYLDPVPSRLSKLVATGHVRSESIQSGARTNIEAQEVVLNFDPISRVPAHGIATGNVRLTIEQSPGRHQASAGSPALGRRISKETLTTEEIRFSFRPGGKNLNEADTSGPGTLVLYPEDPTAGDRIVTAARFLMDFDSSSRLKSLRGTGGTKIVFSPPSNSSNQEAAISTASRIVAIFEPATEAVRSVEQSGNYHLRKGEMEAMGEKAVNLSGQQKLILTGHPEVWDSTTKAQANQIVVNLSSDTAEGIGGVHAIQKDPKGPASIPTNVVAQTMFADRRSQVVHYQGHVRAWRGTDVVESASLDIYRNERRVSTNSRVLTSHLQPASAKSSRDKAGQSGPTPLTIRADRLDYFDAGQRARYSGNVELDTEDTRIKADRLDVYFSSDKKQADAEVERAVAEGHVKIAQPMRYAEGEKAIYDAQQGMVVMTGGPPTVYDTEKGSMTGQRLTFYTHNDRLLVDGSASAPAVSKHRVAQ